MALVAGNTWGHTPRPWGYEVRFEVYDGTDIVTNECLTFEAEPTTTELSQAVATRLEKVNNILTSQEESSNAEEALA